MSAMSDNYWKRFFLHSFFRTRDLTNGELSSFCYDRFGPAKSDSSHVGHVRPLLKKAFLILFFLNWRLYQQRTKFFQVGPTNVGILELEWYTRTSDRCWKKFFLHCFFYEWRTKLCLLRPTNVSILKLKCYTSTSYCYWKKLCLHYFFRIWNLTNEK